LKKASRGRTVRPRVVEAPGGDPRLPGATGRKSVAPSSLDQGCDAARSAEVEVELFAVAPERVVAARVEARLGVEVVEGPARLPARAEHLTVELLEIAVALGGSKNRHGVSCYLTTWFSEP